MELKVEEQPNKLEDLSADIAFGGGDDAPKFESEIGSSLGKFKTTNDLLNAYNNLQAEFTRKCQKLKSLQRELDDIDFLKANETKSENESEIKTNEVPSEMAQQKNDMYDTADNLNVPSYLRADYKETLAKFLSENENAKLYAKEIGEEILKDNNLSLQSAYDKVLARNYKAPNELVTDNEFIEKYILSNNKVMQEILKKYKDNEIKLPTMISETRGSIAQANPVEVKTIKEAGEFAYLLFK